jgi:hypothetical protein
MTESEVVAAGAIGVEAQVADAMEAVRQGVQQNAPKVFGPTHAQFGLEWPSMRFRAPGHPGSSCPQQPPRGEATPAADGHRHFRAVQVLVGIRSTFAVPHLAQQRPRLI